MRQKENKEETSRMAEWGAKMSAFGVKSGEWMSRHTTYRIGGAADFWATFREEGPLLEALCIVNGLPITVIGGGSNLLVSDRGIRGLVIRLRGEFEKVEVDPPYLISGGGASLSQCIRKAAEKGISGFEFLCGVPGTVGGALVNNSGTGDEGILEHTVEVKTFHLPTRKKVILQAKDIQKGYRWSSLKNDGYIILGCRMVGKSGSREEILERMERLTTYRLKTQPIGVPSAGSVFKNPPGHYAGRLLEEAGMKGKRVGKAQVSEKHANFIVNLGGATADEVATLMKVARRRVFDETGITLEPEIERIGDWVEPPDE